MNKRRTIAALALAGIFIALYLTLHRLGFFGGGGLVCTVGSCDVVNASSWATFLGLPVAVWGLGYYLVTFTVGIVALQERFGDSMQLSRALVFLGATGFLFSAWLTYLELFVIRAICQWCVVSALLATGIFVASLLDYRELQRLAVSD
ncbi:MAG TPA: vitamin K epoxide reductase family protein [Gemmatimonadaceae bacterium]|nr:vitamin K epoxide reductase family protein [Gemmatimonadaceae bacterium]